MSILALLIITGWSGIQASNTFEDFYSTALFDYALLCGKPEWQNQETRLQGKSWEEVLSYAQEEFKRGHAKVKESEIKLLGENIQELTSKAYECQKINQLTYSHDEVVMARAVLKAPLSVVSSEEGIEAFVQTTLIPKIALSGMKVLIIGENHQDPYERIFQANLLKQLAGGGIKVAWVAHEWIKITTHNHTDKKSTNFLRDFRDLPLDQFQTALPHYFKYDEPHYFYKGFESGLRYLFDTMKTLHQKEPTYFNLYPLESRYTGVWDTITGKDTTNIPTFDNTELKKYVDELKKDEIGVIITGASHASLDPGHIQDIKSFREEVTDHVLTIVSVSYSGSSHYFFSPLGIIPDTDELMILNNMYPIRNFSHLKDLQRLMNKLTNAYVPHNSPREPYEEMKPLYSIIDNTILKSPPYPPIRSRQHPIVVDISVGRIKEGIDQKTHPLWFADFVYLH